MSKKNENNKPYLLMIEQTKECSAWKKEGPKTFIRLEKPEHAKWELPRFGDTIVWSAVVKDIRETFFDFHDQDMLMSMWNAAR